MAGMVTEGLFVGKPVVVLGQAQKKYPAAMSGGGVKIGLA